MMCIRTAVFERVEQLCVVIPVVVLLSFGARVNVCAINCACKSIGMHELYMQSHCVPLNVKNPVWLAIGTDMSQD